MDSTKFSKPISLKRIQLDDGFWKPNFLVRVALELEGFVLCFDDGFQIGRAHV